MTETRRFAVEEMMSVPMQVLAVNEILKGTFNDEIARLTTLRDEIAKRQDTEKRFVDADALLAESKAASEKAQQELASAQAGKKAIDDQAAQVARSLRELTAAQVQLKSDSAKLASDRSIWEATQANAVKLMDQRSRALDVREDAVSAAETKLANDQNLLAADRDAFNKRLDSLKV